MIDTCPILSCFSILCVCDVVLHATLTGDDIEWEAEAKKSKAKSVDTEETAAETSEKKKPSRKRTKKADEDNKVEAVVEDATEREERPTRRPRKKKATETQDSVEAEAVDSDLVEEAPQKSKKSGRKSDNDDMPIPKGWGDHVPAFLLQSTRKFG